MIQTHKLSKMVFANTDKLNTVCSSLTRFFEAYKMTYKGTSLEIRWELKQSTRKQCI